MSQLYLYFYSLLITLGEISFVLFKGYFLSIEFTLYPYLVRHGFIPYINILDQHFPSLFFGTFSLPLLSASNSLPLLVLFLSAILLGNLLLFRYLLQSKSKNPVLWLGLYSILMSYFSLNILWVEIFINLLLLIVLNLNLKKGRVTNFLIGFVVSQVLLLRPTLLPSLLFFGLFVGLTLDIFMGIAAGLAVSLLHLVINNSFKQFVELAIDFNFSSYAKLASNQPAIRQLIVVASVFAYSIANFLKTKNWKLFGAVALSLLAIFPRFGLEHLQPFIFFTVLLASQNKNKKNWLEYLIIGAVSILIISGLFRNRYGNYFYNPETIRVSEKLKSLPFSEMYLFGASDLLYPLSGKLPAGKLYVPSLPWYLNYPDFEKKLVEALKVSNVPVIVDEKFEVDGVKLIHSAPKLHEYIKMNYNLVGEIENLKIYYKKK